MLEPAREKGVFQRVELARHIILLMELLVVEDVIENLLRENVLHQHFAHVADGDGGIDRPLRMGEEPRLGLRVGFR